MNIAEQRLKALNACIDIANDYTKEEVERFTPPSVQKAWQIGNEFLEHSIKEERKNRKRFTI